ncbi:MAG: dienelactone hydrolase family protein [Methanosarcinaceae archaeon]
MVTNCSNPSTPEEPYVFIDYVLDVEGTTWRHTVAVPRTYSEETAYPLILALHFGGRATDNYGYNFLRTLIEPALGSLSAIMLAPVCREEGGWTTSETEKGIFALLEEMQKKFNIDTSRILITGFSLGAIGTYHFAAKAPHHFAGAIPIAGMPESPDIPLLNQLPLYIIHSRADEIFPVANVEQLATDLKARNVSVELHLVDGISHYSTAGFVRPLEQSISWIKGVWAGDDKFIR